SSAVTGRLALCRRLDSHVATISVIAPSRPGRAGRIALSNTMFPLPPDLAALSRARPARETCGRLACAPIANRDSSAKSGARLGDRLELPAPELSRRAPAFRNGW